MTLPAYLDNPDDRDQHPDIPKPAGEEKRNASAKNNRNDRQCSQECDATCYDPHWKKLFWMRIKNCEIDRQDQLTQIDDVTDDCILQTQEQRKFDDRPVLRENSSNRGSRGEQCERNLFQNERNDFFPLKTIERPVIDQ